jgi:hypothetical protein
MNCIGADLTRYQLGTHYFLSNTEFNLECPPLKGQWGMISYDSEPNSGVKNQLFFWFLNPAFLFFSF